MSTALRETVEAVRLSLQELHKVLLDLTRDAYERERGPVGSPGDYLRLVVHDEWFAWLHPISELVIVLDDLLDAVDSPSAQDGAAVRAEVEELLAHRAGDFRRHYLEMLQKGPEVILAHAKVQKAISGLPAPEPADVAALLHERHRWAVARHARRQARKKDST